VSEDQHTTWAMQLAQGLKAELVVQAISGIGVLPRPFPDYDLWWSPNETQYCSNGSAALQPFMVAQQCLPPHWHELKSGPWIDGMESYVNRVNPFNAQSTFGYKGKAPQAASSALFS